METSTGQRVVAERTVMARILKVTPNGVPTTLYNFCSQSSCPDGSFPVTALVQGANGDLLWCNVRRGCGNLLPHGHARLWDSF